MNFSIEDVGVIFGMMSPVYYYLHNYSVELKKVTTVIDICPYCPHGDKNHDT